MNKRDVKKMLDDIDPDTIEIEYEASDDERQVTLTFSAPKPMKAIDFVEALISFANDFTEMVCRAKNEKDPNLS